MKKPLRLVLALHCHQPVGNFGWVVEEATERCYRPFLELLRRHPSIPATLHVSGPLVHWWQANAPDVLTTLRAGVAGGQFELLTSGLYEPILTGIPRRDRVPQILLHRALLRELFGVDPTGLWLTERVWEPSLAADLAAAGVRSVAVDDHHFEGAGLRRETLDGYHVTEDEGRAVLVFPISWQLRYLIPFRPVEEVLAYLRERHAAGQELLVYADDGEKFGVWPDTHEWVFEKGWLEDFLRALEGASEWLVPCSFSRTEKELRPRGRIYLPTSSYAEMGEWCLPVAAAHDLEHLVARLKEEDGYDAARPFLRGTLWRNMLARYPEAGRMHQRMVRLSERLEEKGLRRDAEALERGDVHPALRALFSGQCNCAYWHGVFGGLYLPFLRDAVVHDLLEAEAALDDVAVLEPRAEPADLDADGEAEVLLRGGGWSLWVAPQRGGLLDVMDHVPSRRNLVNVIARREEAYHQELREALERKAAGETGAAANGSGKPRSIHDREITLEGDPEELFRYDRYPRGGFALHVVEPGTSLVALAEHRLEEAAAAPLLRYAVQSSPAPGSVLLAATLGEPFPVDVERSYRVAADGTLEARVALRRPRPRRGGPRLLAALRLDLSVPGFGADSRYFLREDGTRLRPEDTAEFEGEELELVDEGWRHRLTSSLRFAAAVHPLLAVVRSEAGAARSQQGTTLVLGYAVDLARDREWAVELSWVPRLREE